MFPLFAYICSVILENWLSDDRNNGRHDKRHDVL